MRFRFITSRVVLASLITMGAGCGGGGGYSTGPGNPNPPPPPGTPNSVVVTNNKFTPTDLTVAVGATVTWTWDSCSGGDGYGNGQTCVSHNVTFDQGSANSATQSGGSFGRTFSAAGTYAYHCTIHGTAMSGRAIAQ